MAFSVKRLTAKITLAPLVGANGQVLSQPSFASSPGSNEATLAGYRMSAHITKAGAPSRGELELRVYGLSLKLMNQITTLGPLPVVLSNNKLALTASDGVTAPTSVFQGTIAQAFIDLNNAPDAILSLQAYEGMYEGMLVPPPTSFKGSVDVVTVMSAIAGKMGLNFLNSGVTGNFLTNPYFAGDAHQQADDCARAAKIRWTTENQTVYIWPLTGRRDGAPALISPQTGLIGYPFPAGQSMIGLKTLFNPGIVFGGAIQVRNSSIQSANGDWTVMSLAHDLECEMPGGKWESTLTAIPPGYFSNP